VLSDGLRVRESPSLSAPVVDYLSQAQVVKVQDVDGTDVWAKLGDKRYAAIDVGGKRYMEKA